MEPRTITAGGLDSTALLEYESALRKPFLYIPPDPGCIQISGPDRIDYLQRQTTNDLALLAPGKVIATVLTSPSARILDVLHLYETRTQQSGEDSITAITLPGRARQTADYFRSRIFFMDKVLIRDLSPETAQVLLSGPGTGGILEAIGFPGAPREGETFPGELGGRPAIVHRSGNLVGECFRVVTTSVGARDLRRRLGTLEVREISAHVQEVLRVEMGIPGAETELTDRYTPLEIGLREAVSDSKGCYTGQEVIARQITYDKVTQQLVGIRPEAGVAPGEPIQVDGKKVGEVTSAAISPDLGPLALGVVRRPHNLPGTEVEIGGGESPVPAGVVELPFRLPKRSSGSEPESEG